MNFRRTFFFRQDHSNDLFRRNSLDFFVVIVYICMTVSIYYVKITFKLSRLTLQNPPTSILPLY